MTTPDDIANELTQSFADSGEVVLQKGYQHPKEAEILQKAEDLLAQTDTGARLLQIRNHYKIPVHVLKGPKISYTAPDERTVYITAPAAYEKGIEIVVLSLGCGIRDIEQALVGYGKPSDDLDPTEYATIMYTKSLDIIKTMCQIADELNQRFGFKKALDKVVELGHGPIYEAYKAQMNEEELFYLFVERDQSEEV